MFNSEEDLHKSIAGHFYHEVQEMSILETLAKIPEFILEDKTIDVSRFIRNDEHHLIITYNDTSVLAFVLTEDESIAIHLGMALTSDSPVLPDWAGGGEFIMKNNELSPDTTIH